jgi:hypothetical protein
MHGLVADYDALFVGAHLGAPDPERPAQQRGVCLSYLRGCDITAGNLRGGRMLSAWEEFNRLCLVAFAVAVLVE